MRISQATPLQTVAYPAAPARAEGASASPAPARDSAAFGETVAATVEDWGHMGKKLGSLGAVTLASTYIPMAVANVAYNLPTPVFMPLCLGTSIAAMALTALEEKHLGLGKMVGQAIGSAAGAVVGTGKATLSSLAGSAGRPETVELEKRAALGKPAHEPLLQAGIHSAHRALLKAEPIRNRTIEIGEMVGSTLSTMVMAYTIPHLVGNAIGGPIGVASGTLIGPLCGLVAGGFLENTFGVGRAVGELAGRGVNQLQERFGQPKPSQAEAPATKCAMPDDPKAGPLKRGFLKMNHLIGQPIMGFLVDTTMVANLAFAEKPYQSIEFQQRPSPQVNRQRLIDNFMQLAGIHGPSGQEKLVGDAICQRLDSLGIAWERQPNGNVIGTLPATPGQEDAPTVMLSSHQDTVEATKAENLRLGTRRIHTNEKGVLGADDRAGIAEILEAIQVVKEQSLAHPEVKLVFTVDEERGLVGAHALKPEEISSRPTLGFVVDALDVRDLHLTNDAVILQPDSVKYNFSQEDPLVQVVFRSQTNTGLKPRPIHAPILTGAGSDANTLAFNSKNIRSIAVGAGERDMHTPLEYIKIDDLEQASRQVVGYITNSCDLKVEGDKIVPRYSLN